MVVNPLFFRNTAMLAQLIRKVTMPKRRNERCTAIFSDVDGVILPKFLGGAPRNPEAWGEVNVRWQETSYFRPSLLASLRNHPADYKLWLSTWGDSASEVFDEHTGQWTSLTPDEMQNEWWHHGITDWWKANLLLDWASKHPEVTHVVWCDDELNDDDRVDAARIVYNELRASGIRVMSICPQPEIGLSDDHIDIIGTFAKGGI
jgi:hypothetical protein